MDFPHLKDTQFPQIDNVNVYKYQNNFDYARWQGKVNYKLINVKWNSVYNDVPYFNTVEERDAWFDSQEGYIDTLESVFNNTPKNSLKVPLPFNDAYHYNYIIIDMPIQTSESQPLNYANDSMRVKRWFYFIEDMNQLSPSTTELQLSIDYWTTFVNTVSIPYLMLERGHAPMMQTTVNQYLANPIANNEYLLADDFNYGKEMSQVMTSMYYPIGEGKKYVLFAVPFTQNDFATLGGTPYSGSSTLPTFSDTSERWGNQIVVNGYEWKFDSTDYTSANLPIDGLLSQDNKIFNGTYVYAIDSINASTFFDSMAHNYVNFMHAVQCVFILDESMFTKKTGFTFHNYTIYPISMKANISDINLTKSMFGFEPHYENITKLYTSPYSYLEFTDDNGNSFDMRIELCGDLKLHNEISIIFPYLRYNVFLSGVNGDGNISYTWKNLNDSNVSKSMWADDFSKFMMNWNIPTYSVYISSENEYAANNAAGMDARRKGAIVDYENAVRYANTTYENTDDSFTTSTSNVNRTTTKNVTNTSATQAGLIDNMEDTNDTCDTVTDDITNGSGGSLSPLGTGYLPTTTWANWEKLADDADTDWMFVHDAFNANAEYFTGMAVANGVASIVGGAAATSGSVYSSEKTSQSVGSAIPFIGGIASAIATTVSIPLTITKDQTLTNLQQNVINDKTSHAYTNLNKVMQAQIAYNHDVKEANNDLRESITERFSDVNGINNANEARNKTCDDANAYATQVTETNNADWTRDANVVAEQNILIQKQREAEAQYKNAKLQRPTLQGSYAGDAYPDIWQRRGIRLNIRTQSKSAIAQAGDAMLRFGYALHRVWDMDNGFHYGKNFTYWKAEDIWINDGTGVANVATNAIANILLSGVTVWKDPDKIGTIGIYDNI